MAGKKKRRREDVLDRMARVVNLFHNEFHVGLLKSPLVSEASLKEALQRTVTDFPSETRFRVASLRRRKRMYRDSEYKDWSSRMNRGGLFKGTVSWRWIREAHAAWLLR